MTDNTPYVPKVGDWVLVRLNVRYFSPHAVALSSTDADTGGGAGYHSSVIVGPAEPPPPPKTKGQVAYEAPASRRWRLMPWADLIEAERADWESVAQAVLDAQ